MNRVRQEIIGPCRLFCGDSLEILPELEDESVDLVVADPPYSSGGAFRGDRAQSTKTKYQSSQVIDAKPLFSGDNRDGRSYLAWCSLWLIQLERILKPGAMCCLFSDWRQLPTMTDAIQVGGFVWRGILPWDKVDARPMPNRFRSQCEYLIWSTKGPRDFSTAGATYHPGMLRHPAPTGNARQHSTQKPVEILAEIIKVTREGETVVDNFMGSGSTGVACIETDRQFIGIEKDPTYFRIACDRIAKAWKAKNSELPLDEPPKRKRQPLVMPPLPGMEIDR